MSYRGRKRSLLLKVEATLFFLGAAERWSASALRDLCQGRARSSGDSIEGAWCLSSKANEPDGNPKEGEISMEPSSGETCVGRVVGPTRYLASRRGRFAFEELHSRLEVAGVLGTWGGLERMRSWKARQQCSGQILRILNCTSLATERKTPDSSRLASSVLHRDHRTDNR